MKKTISTLFLVIVMVFISHAQKNAKPFVSGGLSGDWKLKPAFSDEFDRGFKSNKWDKDPVDWGGWSWDPNKVKVSGGELKLTMDWDKRGNKRHLDNDGIKDQLYFKSGIIRSRQKLRYGYFEASIKAVGKHPGAAPAFWVYSHKENPINIDGVSVKYNEIDFIELMQRPDSKLADHNVIKQNTGATKKVKLRKTTRLSFFPVTGYHIYGCHWTPNKIDFYIDGKRVKTIKAKSQHFQKVVLSLGPRPPYVNLETGRPEIVNSRPSGFPTNMKVKYVRVWQDSNVSGRLIENTSQEEESTTSKNINVYEESNSNLLNISVENVNGYINASIIDIQGKVIITKSSTKKNFTLDTSSLSKGLYVLQIKNGNEFYNSKLIH